MGASVCVLVTGGRDYTDRARVYQCLDYLHRTRDVWRVMQGGARGADKLAEEWAATNEVECLRVPARWKIGGKRAGMARNARMADYRPDVVMAFPGGAGTEVMVGIARARGIELIEVDRR